MGETRQHHNTDTLAFRRASPSLHLKSRLSALSATPLYTSGPLDPDIISLTCLIDLASHRQRAARPTHPAQRARGPNPGASRYLFALLGGDRRDGLALVGRRPRRRDVERALGRLGRAHLGKRVDGRARRLLRLRRRVLG